MHFFSADAVSRRLVEAPWWGAALGEKGLAWWLNVVDVAALAAQPLRRRQGLLHAAADLLKHLGHRLQACHPLPLLHFGLQISVICVEHLRAGVLRSAETRR